MLRKTSSAQRPKCSTNDAINITKYPLTFYEDQGAFSFHSLSGVSGGISPKGSLTALLSSVYVCIHVARVRVCVRLRRGIVCTCIVRCTLLCNDHCRTDKHY